MQFHCCISENIQISSQMVGRDVNVVQLCVVFYRKVVRTKHMLKMYRFSPETYAYAY